MLSTQMDVQDFKIEQNSASVLNDRVGSEEYEIVYELIAYHETAAAALEKINLDYYLDNKALLIAPIKSVQVKGSDGNSYYIIKDGSIVSTYPESSRVILTSGADWSQKLQDNFF